MSGRECCSGCSPSAGNAFLRRVEELVADSGVHGGRRVWVLGSASGNLFPSVAEPLLEPRHGLRVGKQE